MTLTDLIILFKEVFIIIAAVSLCLYFFVPVYSVIGFFSTKKFPKAKKYHKYAIMIAARNEEAVIGNLIDSINSQDYPQDKVGVFVVADNCTDDTAAISRAHGAVCYERFDPDHRTKGYALEFLVDNISRDYGIEAFDAYFIFDADNLLKKDYLSRMNEAFDSGEKIVTSYRNTKNFGDNWIAASYGLHWLRTIRYEHRGRSALGLACRIQGTGFMFASEIIKNGWHYVSFTEDRSFAADAVVGGYRISYCDRAEFYDEQPTSLRIALRQRIRWGKGHLQAFAESGPKLLYHIFSSVRQRPVYKMAEPNDLRITDATVSDIYNDVKKSLFSLADFKSKPPLCMVERLILLPFVFVLCPAAIALTLADKGINALFVPLKNSRPVRSFLSSSAFGEFKIRFMSYDMFIITFPNNLISIITTLLKFLANIALVFTAGSAVTDAFSPFAALLTSFVLKYAGSICLGAYVFFIERRRIVAIPLAKKIFYTIMWPMFDIIGEISVLIALFAHVEWKPIPHNVNVSIEDINTYDK